MALSRIVASMQLEPHPEGGYYRRFYESSEKISLERGERFCSTAIHYLLEGGGVSKLHTLKSDELWFHHSGKSLTVVEIIVASEGERPVIKKTKVGSGPDASLAYNVKAGHLFGAFLERGEEKSGGEGEGDFSLVSCVVTPGFDFADWVMPSLSQVLALWKEPSGLTDEDKSLLVKMCKPDDGTSSYR